MDSLIVIVFAIAHVVRIDQFYALILATTGRLTGFLQWSVAVGLLVATLTIANDSDYVVRSIMTVPTDARIGIAAVVYGYIA